MGNNRKLARLVNAITKVSTTVTVEGNSFIAATPDSSDDSARIPSTAWVRAFLSTASLTGYVPYTGAVSGINMGTNNGITLTDTGTNTSINITSSSTGNGAIKIDKSGAGEGIRVNNNGVGNGFYAYNASTGTGLLIGNMSTGKGLTISNASGATGDPFVYNLGGAAFVKYRIDYLGNVTGNNYNYSGTGNAGTSFTSPLVNINGVSMNIGGSFGNASGSALGVGGDLLFTPSASIKWLSNGSVYAINAKINGKGYTDGSWRQDIEIWTNLSGGDPTLVRRILIPGGGTTSYETLGGVHIDMLTVDGVCKIVGITTLSNLAGTGDRIVISNSLGVLTTATIGSGLSYSGGILSSTGGGGGLSGSGTAGYLAKWSSSSALTNSIISETGLTVTVAGTLSATTLSATDGSYSTSLTAPTKTPGDNSTNVATTAYADNIASAVLQNQYQIANVYSDVATLTTASETLFFYNIPLIHLSEIGDKVSFSFSGYFTANGFDKYVTFQINSTTIHSTGNASNWTEWRINGYFIRTGSTTIRTHIEDSVKVSGNWVYRQDLINDYAVGSFDPLSFYVKGQTSSAVSPVTLKLGYLESKKITPSAT